MLRVYLIRLTREYTDGGMDSRAEEEKGTTQGNRRSKDAIDHRDFGRASRHTISPAALRA